MSRDVGEGRRVWCWWGAYSALGRARKKTEPSLVCGLPSTRARVAMRAESASRGAHLDTPPRPKLASRPSSVQLQYMNL